MCGRRRNARGQVGSLLHPLGRELQHRSGVMGGGHKTVKYQFLDDGSPAPKPVAVEAPVSEADTEPETVEAEDLSERTVAELRVRADRAGVHVDGLL